MGTPTPTSWGPTLSMRLVTTRQIRESNNLKKRVLRRLTTAKGAFLHAPGYGVGIPQRLKQLNIPHVREELVADATNQISQEPDVLKVLVTANISASDPMTCYFYVYIQTTLGFAVKYDVPFQITDPS